VHELREVYEKAFSKHSGEQVADAIRKFRGSASVYQRLDTTLAHPQAAALGLMVESKRDGRTVRHRRFPARFGHLQMKPLARAPKLGEHTQQIAREAGMTAEQLGELLK